MGRKNIKMRKRSLVILIAFSILLSALAQVYMVYSADTPALFLTGTLSTTSISYGSKVTVFASVKDADGNPVEDATVTAYLDPLTIKFRNDRHGVYHVEIDTGDLIEGSKTYTLTLVAEKSNHEPSEINMDLKVGGKSQDWLMYVGVVLGLGAVLAFMVRSARRL